jgi:hypothetical protein
MFQILCLETKEYATDDAGNVMVYATGNVAKLAADTLSAQTGRKHQPRRVANVDWRQRERDRFNDGTYRHLPWANDHWFCKRVPADHFPHVASKPGLIAYTENAEKGAADVQTAIKPGRYLERFFSERLTAEEIRTLAHQFVARFGNVRLFFATTPETITEIYQRGPNSCMSGKSDNYFSKPYHPCSVYGAGDLAVAYLAQAEEDDDSRADLGTITARAVCWPDKRVFTRCYGNTDKLEAALREAGYQPGRLTGARLLKIEHDDGGFVVPFIDWHDRIGHAQDGKHLLIDGGAKPFIATGYTTGLSQEHEQLTCAHCDEQTGDDLVPVYLHGGWCGACVDSDAYFCERMRGHFACDHVECHTVWPHEESWSQHAVDRYAFFCEGSERWYDRSLARPVAVIGKDGDPQAWSSLYYQDHGARCAGCCLAHHVDALTDGHCARCAAELERVES